MNFKLSDNINFKYAILLSNNLKMAIKLLCCVASNYTTHASLLCLCNYYSDQDVVVIRQFDDQTKDVCLNMFKWVA